MPLLTLTACLPTNDGKYLIYKTETVPTYGLAESGLDYGVSENMLGEFKGKKFDLKFNPKYATLREENSDEDLILNKVSNTEQPEYVLDYIKNKEKVHLKLYDRTENGSKDLLMFVTIHEQIIDSLGQTVNGRYGLIKCHLTKPTN